MGDGKGNINDIKNAAIGAGLGDSCASCHGRPRGSAGFGGDVATKPDSRDAPRLFGLGLKEMLADEITSDLQAIKAQAILQAYSSHRSVTKQLKSKHIDFGAITVNPDGAVDTSKVEEVDPDLRVRPFFAEGKKISIRESIVGPLQDEMGLQAVDPDLYDAAIKKKKITTPSGMVLDGSMDKIEAPPTNDPKTDLDQDEVVNEVPTSLVDHLEFYLLNYFEQALYQQTKTTRYGSEVFRHIHCVECHIPNLKIDHNRRVAQGSPSPVMEALNCQFCSMIQRISNSRLRFNRL